jgi:LacI family transcriptional regulator
MNTSKKITIIDIAEALGVSKTLVSLVLSGKGDEHGISKVLQEKVLKKAQELNYNYRIFKGIKTKTNVVAIILPEISSPFSVNFFEKVQLYLLNYGYSTILAISDYKVEKEKSLINTFIDKQVEGIIIHSINNDTNFWKEINYEELPILFIKNIPNQLICNYALVDNLLAGQQATEYLLANGHKHIACLINKNDSAYYSFFEGYKLAFNNSLENYNDFYFVELENEKKQSIVHKLLSEWLNNKILPTAIVSGSYDITLSIIKACNELKIKIPTQLSLISYDDTEVFELLNPSITSISFPYDSLAKFSAEAIIKINKKLKANRKLENLEQAKFEGNLVIRESVSKYNIDLMIVR